MFMLSQPFLGELEASTLKVAYFVVFQPGKMKPENRGDFPDFC